MIRKSKLYREILLLFSYDVIYLIWRINIMRKMATIRVIRSLESIPGADTIEKATIGGWEVVVKKGEFSVGEKCVYCEVDSLLPSDNPHFEFLRSKKFRIKTCRFRGQISSGILFKIEELFKVENINGKIYINISDDSKLLDLGDTNVYIPDHKFEEWKNLHRKNKD